MRIPLNNLLVILVVAAFVLPACGGAPVVTEEDVPPPETSVEGWSPMCDGFRYTIRRRGDEYVCANSYVAEANNLWAYAAGQCVANWGLGVWGPPVTVIHQNGSVEVYE